MAPVPWPPKTLADLKSLASAGDGTAIHEFHSEGTGLSSCPEPKRSATAPDGLTAQQLAADMLAYFFAQGLDNNCGSLLLVYHAASEGGGAYTYGRIDLTVTSTKVFTIDVVTGSDSLEFRIS